MKVCQAKDCDGTRDSHGYCGRHYRLWRRGRLPVGPPEIAELPAGARSRDWVDRAACRDEDPELFFPTGSGEHADRQSERAGEVCRRCPVLMSCLNYALATGPSDGVWAGTTPEQRRQTPAWFRPGRVRLDQEATA